MWRWRQCAGESVSGWHMGSFFQKGRGGRIRQVRAGLGGFGRIWAGVDLSPDWMGRGTPLWLVGLFRRNGSWMLRNAAPCGVGDWLRLEICRSGRGGRGVKGAEWLLEIVCCARMLGLPITGGIARLARWLRIKNGKGEFLRWE
jgi:hypothetical protein